MFRRRNDVPAEVELIDLSEGDDVDPVNVAAPDLIGNTQLNLTVRAVHALKKKKRKEKVN